MLWGAFHGLMLLVERATGVGRGDGSESGRDIVGQLRTIALVLFAWILFRSPDLPYAIGYMESLLRPAGGLTLDVALALDPLAAIALLIGAGERAAAAGLGDRVRLERNATPRTRLLRLAAGRAVFPASVVFLIAAGFSPFLYFRF